VPKEGKKLACFQCSLAKKKCSFCPDRSRSRAKSAPAAAKKQKSHARKERTPHPGSSTTGVASSRSAAKAKQNRVPKSEGMRCKYLRPQIINIWQEPFQSSSCLHSAHCGHQLLPTATFPTRSLLSEKISVCYNSVYRQQSTIWLN
jgi:hypothetical protein